MNQLGLPVENAVAGLAPEQFFIPGSLIRTEVDVEHPLARGMQKQASAFFSRSRAFEVVYRSDTREGGKVKLGPVPEFAFICGRFEKYRQGLFFSSEFLRDGAESHVKPDPM
jgi:hypothetical protein